MQSRWLSNMTQDVLLRGCAVPIMIALEPPSRVLTSYVTLTLYVSMMCAILKVKCI